MPIYEYECEACGLRFERVQRFSDKPLRVCPECEGTIHRVIHPVGIIFKGSGFYVTDSRGKSSTLSHNEKAKEPKQVEAQTDATGTTQNEKKEMA